MASACSWLCLAAAYSRNVYCTTPRLFRLWAISGWSGGRDLRRIASACSWLCLAAAYSRNSYCTTPRLFRLVAIRGWS